jgi:hypothetical protein
MNEIASNDKKPSEQLLGMIEDFGRASENLKDLVKRIKRKGHEEGFSDFEIILLARKLLQKSLTRGQMNHWFAARRNIPYVMEKSSRQYSQVVYNDENKLMELSPRQITSSPVEGHNNNNMIRGNERDSEQIVNSNDDSTIKPTAKIGIARSISYLDLVNPGTIDCTNHPMYRSANEKIEQLKLALFEKTEETRRLKVEISYKH